MNSDLARALLTKGAIRRGTVIHCYQNVKDLSCMCNAKVLAHFVVTGARLIGGTKVVFDATDDEQVSYAIVADLIMQIDGMDVDRMARSHYLTLDGLQIRHSRRGRARKTLSDQMPIPA